MLGTEWQDAHNTKRLAGVVSPTPNGKSRVGQVKNPVAACAAFALCIAECLSASPRTLDAPASKNQPLPESTAGETTQDKTIGALAEHTVAKPYIIFIFADDWGCGDLGIHGSTFCKTPNLDRMAAEGIEFTNFTVNSPVCSPSRTAVMTGHFPARYCIHQHFGSVAKKQGKGHAELAGP